MADYRKMYYVVCAAASKAIDAPPEQARAFLQQALDAAEEIYIRTCDADDQEAE